MILHTKRLMIIPCNTESLSTHKTKDYEIGHHIKNYLVELAEDSSLLGWGVWLVINKESNKIIGDIGFKGKPDKENTVEVGYGIIPSAQKKGFATEAVNEIINWAFSTGEVKRIIAECLIDNFASAKVLEKLHFDKISTKENMYLWQLNK